MNERRRHRRQAVKIRALIKSRWQLLDGTCTDASQTGLHITSDDEFDVGQEVEVALDLDDGTRIYCDGRIVREDATSARALRGRGYGVQLVDPSDEAREALAAWLERAAKSPPGGPAVSRGLGV